MAIQPQQVSCLEAPTISKYPSAQATSLEEVINYVNRSVEATKKEFEDLTSWLLHRGEYEREEKCGFVHAEKVPVNEHGNRNFTLENHETHSQSKWDVPPREPHREEIQKPQSYGEDHCELYYPHNCRSQSPPDQSYHSWPRGVRARGKTRVCPCGKSPSEQTWQQKFHPWKPRNTLPEQMGHSPLGAASWRNPKATILWWRSLRALLPPQLP